MSAPNRQLATVDATAVATAGAPGIIRPVANPAEMRQALADYEAIKTAIVGERDVVTVRGKNGQLTRYIKKKGWLNIAGAFGLTCEPVSERFERDEETGDWGYSVTMRALAPNGRSMQGDGSCWASEKRDNNMKATRHNVRAHAFTRAMNRAISNLVGGGEVSAEEISAGNPDEDEPRAAQSAPPAERTAERATRAPGKPKKPSWADLEQRAYAAGVRDKDEWRDVVTQVTGKLRDYDGKDYSTVERHVARLEQTKARLDDEAAAEATGEAQGESAWPVDADAPDAPEEPGDGAGVDLAAAIPGGPVRP